MFCLPVACHLLYPVDRISFQLSIGAGPLLQELARDPHSESTGERGSK